MMFKKKCPVCGAKNNKERMVCIECGAPLASEHVKRQLSQVSTEGETQAKKQVEKAPKKKVEDEYWDNERVLYKTRCKLSLPHKNPQEADCLVTEGHVMIEAEEPIHIPVSHIQVCVTSFTTPSYYDSSQPQEPFTPNATLTFIDNLNRDHKIDLGIPLIDLNNFKEAVDKQIVGRLTNTIEERPPNTALAKFFSGVGNFFRNKTRDNICTGLQRLGINARMVLRGRPEEEIGGSGSLGIIHIPGGPIRWINVRKETHGSGQSSSTYYYTEYGVLDPRLGPDSPGTRIETIRVKTFPLFGKVVDLRWEGRGSDLGIINRLNSDEQLKQPIMESRDVTITAREDYGCWIMSTETREVPSEELWNCYQKIAGHLLAESLHSGWLVPFLV